MRPTATRENSPYGAVTDAVLSSQLGLRGMGPSPFTPRTRTPVGVARTDVHHVSLTENSPAVPLPQTILGVVLLPGQDLQVGQVVVQPVPVYASHSRRSLTQGVGGGVGFCCRIASRRVSAPSRVSACRVSAAIL